MVTAPKSKAPGAPPPAGKLTADIDERLDEELDQTFPASDPLPWHHDIAPTMRTMIRKPRSRRD